MTVVERNQLRLLPWLENRAIHFPRSGRGIGRVVHADPKIAAVRRERQPGVAVAAWHGRDVFAFPCCSTIGRLEEPQAVTVSIARGSQNGIGSALKLVSVYVNRPYRSVRAYHYAWPTKGGVQCHVVPNYGTPPSGRIVVRDICVQRAFRIGGREHIVGAAVIAADRIHRMLSWAMVAGRAAPS